MSRVIKFRAWDSWNKKMFDLDPAVCKPVPSLNDIESSDTWHVMQFTGLHDREGKEIYEGDLLATYDRIVQVYWNERIAAFDTRFVRYEGEPQDNYPGLSAPQWEHRATVCGNIYEEVKP